jgi:hypothetical protein
VALSNYETDGTFVRFNDNPQTSPLEAANTFYCIEDIPNATHGDWVRVLYDEKIYPPASYGPVAFQAPSTTWVYDATYNWTESNYGQKNGNWRLMSVDPSPVFLGAGGSGPGGRFRGAVPYGVINNVMENTTPNSHKLFLVGGFSNVSLDSRAVGRYWRPAMNSNSILTPSLSMFYANSTTSVIGIPHELFYPRTDYYGFVWRNSTAATIVTMSIYDRESDTSTGAVNYGDVSLNIFPAVTVFSTLAEQRKFLTPYAIKNPQPGDWCITIMDYAYSNTGK